MNTTQQHLLISDIKDDIVILKTGGGALVLQVSAVNFGLLSDREQIGIISSFAQMLNSLSFSIQIVIYSERLNISSYLNLLQKAEKAQTNPLLSNLIGNYHQFIQTTIKENDVLDKKFYLIIPLFSLELGLTASKEHLEQKVKTILLPRRDQVIRQLNRVGLKATQLTARKLLELFYDIYNGQYVETILLDGGAQINVNLGKPQLEQSGKLQKVQTSQNISQPVSQKAVPPPSNPADLPRTSKTHPFVVEELEG